MTETLTLTQWHAKRPSVSPPRGCELLLLPGRFTTLPGLSTRSPAHGRCVLERKVERAIRGRAYLTWRDGND